jgi:DHA2 family multidrug resistance protein
MGNATSLFNLMRNIGGALGIAVIAMLNTRYQQKYINVLGSHVVQGDPATGQWLGALRSMFLGTGSGPGSGPGSAEQRAYGAMFGLVQQQAAMRAFLDIFTLVTVMFLLMIPLLLLMRKPKRD